MKYTIVINGCSDRWLPQLEELYYFINNNMADYQLTDNDGSTQEENCTLFFYNKTEDADKALSHIFTQQIIFVKVKAYQPETLLNTMKEIEQNAKRKSELFLFSGEKSGMELAVRLSCRLNGSSLTSVDEIKKNKDSIRAEKAVYSNYMQGEFLLKEKPYCISINKGKGMEIPFTKTKAGSLRDCIELPTIMSIIDSRDISEVSFLDRSNISEDFILTSEYQEMNSSEGLEKDEFILAAGRGVKSKEKTLELQKVAEGFGAGFGVTRPIAMNAWADMSCLIGVSGNMLKPKLCITAGASGAPAFYAGIEKSDYIIAIDADERAPIHKACNISIVDDYEAVLTALADLAGGETS